MHQSPSRVLVPRGWAVGGALPAGSRTACRGAQGALAAGHHPYLVRDLPSESHPCPCGGEKGHAEHGGCGCGQWAGAVPWGALSCPQSRRALTALPSCPGAAPVCRGHVWHQRMWQSTRGTPRLLSLMSGGEKERTTWELLGHIAALLPARRKPPLICVSFSHTNPLSPATIAEP